ncbi:MAG: glycosyltransferase family 2 protein, partial [Calditrichaeota bacterium]|nr:glycosyltransferase family 2 protein [Calditrichota bacterium]
VGGDGAIYAIRRNLFWTLKDDDINDFVNPLQIVAKGYRGIFNPQAICYEDAAEAFGKEFRRKRRIVNRSWRAV